MRLGCRSRQFCKRLRPKDVKLPYDSCRIVIETKAIIFASALPSQSLPKDNRTIINAFLIGLLMLLRYFLVDTNDQFRLVPSNSVEDVWAGRRTTRVFHWPVGDEFKVVSVLCDDDSLEPKMCFFLRTEVKNDEITDESRMQAYDAMTRHHRRHQLVV